MQNPYYPKKSSNPSSLLTFFLLLQLTWNIDKKDKNQRKKQNLVLAFNHQFPSNRYSPSSKQSFQKTKTNKWTSWAKVTSLINSIKGNYNIQYLLALWESTLPIYITNRHQMKMTMNGHNTSNISYMPTDTILNISRTMDV